MIGKVNGAFLAALPRPAMGRADDGNHFAKIDSELIAAGAQLCFASGSDSAMLICSPDIKYADYDLVIIFKLSGDLIDQPDEDCEALRPAGRRQLRRSGRLAWKA